MEGTAKAKFQRGSARKMRRVAEVIRGLNVDHAAAMLRLMPHRSAKPLAKVILSARANALAVEGTAHHHAEDFVVSEVLIDGGPIARRFRPASMGRANRIRKRFCHLHVVVSDQVATGGKRRAAAPVTSAAPADASTEDSE